jgi:ComF family protein
MAEEMRIAGFLDSVDVLLPVPLSSKRLRQRGYNQSEMLCRGIREITNIPVETKVLIRKHFYQSQTHLMRHQRQANVAEMFHLRDAAGLAGKHVLLVDDICTTGATLIACINALNEIPRLRVSVLTLGFTKS